MTKHAFPAIVLLSALASAACSAPTAVFAKPGEIRNDAVVVRYDAATGAFTVADAASGKVFLKEGKLDGAAGKAREEAAVDPVFGQGRRIAVPQATGGEVALEVYPDLPFALVRETVVNGTKGEADFKTVVPATFAVDLGKPAADLKTLGTGGLNAAGKDPGSYLFLAIADPATRDGVVAGWVTQEKGSGTVFSSVNQGQVAFKAQTEHGHLLLGPGKSARMDIFAVGHFNDARLGLERFADAVKAAHHIRLRPAQATYCSWYAEGPGHGGAGNETNTVELATFCAKEKLPAYGLGVLQIDDRWEDGPQIGGPARHYDRVNPNGPYKHGIAPVAKAVEENGMTFGLWWLPFGRNHMEADFKDKQDWFFKRQDGTPLRQNAFGGTCLDASVPAVAEHLEGLGKLLRSWGVKYYKMDGLSTGAGVDQVYINDGYKNDRFGGGLPPHDRGLTHIEVMRRGLEAIRKGAGDDVFFSGCAATQNMRIYAGALGLVDSMRVGPDFNHDGQGIRSGVLRGSRMYFLNGKVWWNDPDPSKVRASAEGCDADGSINGAVSLDQARMTSSWAALTGQFFLLSDWIPNLPQERLEVLRRTMSHQDGVARPVDYFDNALPNTWLTTSEASGAKRSVVGVFNYHGNPLSVDYSFAKMGLEAGKTYHAFDFWDNKPLPDFKDAFKAEAKPLSCRVIAVRADEGHPALLSTSRHVSQGILEVKEEKWDGSALSGASAVVGGDAYELRIAGLSDGGAWKPGVAEVSAEDKAAGVAVTQETADGLLRVRIDAPAGRTVKWKVGFTR